MVPMCRRLSLQTLWKMLWTTLFLLHGLVLLLLLAFTRRRKAKEPPLDKGCLPWLGHALAFRRDTAKFLAEMKEKHGDIFTVRVAGHYLTVLLDPNSFDGVLEDTVLLDVVRSRNQMKERVFSLQLPSVQPAAERSWMERRFRGGCLSELSSSMKAHLQTLLTSRRQDFGPCEWKQEGLFNLCYSLLFRAGYLTLFEKSDNADDVYKEFRKFDDLLAKLARRSLNKGERRRVVSSRECLWELLSPNSQSRGPGSESWQRSYRRFLQDEGVDPEMQKRALLLQLWTTQCNAGPAAFWLLGFLLTHPEAMKAVKSEIGGLRLWDGALHTPVLDSVLSETLRLTAAVLISREVLEDKTLRLSSGREYRIRRGDKLCLFPFLSPQMDPQIHLEPQTFKYDRFLNGDLTPKESFYKDGRRMTYGSLPWGAGSSTCVGKAFAEVAIKEFVFLLLTHLDLEVCPPGARLPPADPSRYGFGILQPNGDLQVRYRPKRNLQ